MLVYLHQHSIGENVHMESKSKKVWNALFLPKIGDKVKILRIHNKSRLNVVPFIVKYIGREGTIYEISTGKFVNRNKEVQTYSVLFQISPREEWVFEREDFEVIQ